MTNTPPKNIIGRAEKINLPGLDTFAIPAKVDTGADLSSIWASDIKVESGLLTFKLFGEGSKYYTGQELALSAKDYRLTRISNSFGTKELRYVVKLSTEVAGRKVRATFTLSDRSTKLYPVLLGRRLLKGKFIVDVSVGDPLHEEEKAKHAQLEAELKKIPTRA